MKLSRGFFNAFGPKLLVAVGYSVAGLLAPYLAAQQQSFRIAPDHSVARIFIGTRQDPKLFNVAVARVSGEARIDPDNLEESTFNLSVYAANESAVSDPDRQALAGNLPVISFQSQHTTERSDGTLQVDGQLTVTRAEPDVMGSPGEDYSGPGPGTTQLIHASHGATFIFILGPLAIKSSPGSPTDPEGVHVLRSPEILPEEGILLRATMTINGEVFPELLSWIEQVGWPVATTDLVCKAAASVGEDYRGLQCTGRVIDVFTSPTLPVRAGEDYSGIKNQPVEGNLVTIDLGLVVAGSAGSY